MFNDYITILLLFFLDIHSKEESIGKFDQQVVKHKNVDIDYTTSKKGRIQLIYDGHTYVREKTTNMKVYWRCTQYTTIHRCRARLHTHWGKIIYLCEHNHAVIQTHRSKKHPSLNSAQGHNVDYKISLQKRSHRTL